MHTLKLIPCCITFASHYSTLSFCVGVYQRHILMCQYLPTLLCKTTAKLTDCEGISYADPSSDHPRGSIGDRDEEKAG